MSLFFRRQRHRDPLEWRNDRLARLDLYLIFNRDVDRAIVAVATYEAQERQQTDADGCSRQGDTRSENG